MPTARLHIDRGATLVGRRFGGSPRRRLAHAYVIHCRCRRADGYNGLVFPRRINSSRGFPPSGPTLLSVFTRSWPRLGDAAAATRACGCARFVWREWVLNC